MDFSILVLLFIHPFWEKLLSHHLIKSLEYYLTQALRIQYSDEWVLIINII